LKSSHYRVRGDDSISAGRDISTRFLILADSALHPEPIAGEFEIRFRAAFQSAFGHESNIPSEVRVVFMQGTLADLAPDIVTSEQIRCALEVAEDLRVEHDLDEALLPYRDDCYSFDSADFDAADFDSEDLASAGKTGPTLHLEDVSGIPFVADIPGVAEYQHRARVRAGHGDLFAAATEPVEGYEDYCRNKLGLGAPDFIRPGSSSGPMAIATACAEDENVELIAAWMRQRGGLTIHPYMAIEPVWELARKLNKRVANDDRADDKRAVDSRAARVLGPPPPVLWIANDKASLCDIIDRVSDGAWSVETRPETSPKSMARTLCEMANRHPKVGLKRTRCASAMGNIVFDSAMLRRAELSEVEDLVAEFLRKTEWENAERVLVVEWAETRESPSTQMWIPPRPAVETPEPASSESAAFDDSAGRIRLDGVYQQILSGPHGTFVGSRPSTLPAAVERKLAEASFVVAAVFQRLGYVGRCSFDFIVVGDPRGDFEVRMIECNGRWGGTSTPMHLVDRLVPGPRPAYIAQDYVHPGLVGARLIDLLAAVGDDLFDARTGRGRFIFYNCGPLAPTGKIDVISLGDSPQQARDGVKRILPQRLGLS
jgi:hypothetical protein